MSLSRHPEDTRFLSDEDLDLEQLSDAELAAWWAAWFTAAQASNDDDQFLYSHGCFAVDPRHPELLDLYPYT